MADKKDTNEGRDIWDKVLDEAPGIIGAVGLGALGAKVATRRTDQALKALRKRTDMTNPAAVKHLRNMTFGRDVNKVIGGTTTGLLGYNIGTAAGGRKRRK